MSNQFHPRRLGMIVGGGPAPGINGVISAATIEAIERGAEVFGFRDGFKWLVKGSTEHYRKLTIEEVKGVHLRGGSILGTARTNPAKNPQDMARVLDVFRKLGLDALVTIGGDDTAFSGSQVYQQAGGAIRVAHVPKTIDNDLPLPGSTPTFGFETARQFGTVIVRNMAEDACTTSRWYLVVSMGRAAGHLALGIGKAAAATLTIIPEEFHNRQVSLDEVCDIILGSIIKETSEERYHGIVMLAEGLLEAIGATRLREAMGDNLERYGAVTKDEHGHLRLGEIEFGRIVKDQLDQRLKPLGLKTTFVDKDLGYELRCADPIPFDAEYTRDLGYGAFKFLRSQEAGQFGAIISFVEGRLVPLRFENLLDPITKRMKTRRVAVDGEGYECARRYMSRLEKRDFEDEAALRKLATTVMMEPQQFKERFGYLV